MAKENPLDDNYLKTIVPGIIFTRQKSCTDVLVELLKTDEKNCIPANPNYSGAIPCRYRIVAALAKVVNDFPIKVKRSGDLITNDYEKSLQEAISWFNENPNYTFVE